MQENGSPLFCGKSICRSIAVSLFLTVTVHIPILFRGTLGQFTPEYIKTLFRLTRELSDLQKYILSGAIKVIFVRSSWGNLSFFFSKLQGLQHYFSKNCRCNLMSYEIEHFFYSSLHYIFSLHRKLETVFSSNACMCGSFLDG